MYAINDWSKKKEKKKKYGYVDDSRKNDRSIYAQVAIRNARINHYVNDT